MSFKEAIFLIIIAILLSQPGYADTMETKMLQPIDYGRKGMVSVTIMNGEKLKVKTSAPVINHERMVYEDDIINWTFFWAGTGLVPVNEQSIIVIENEIGEVAKFAVEINEETGRFFPITLHNPTVIGS